MNSKRPKSRFVISLGACLVLASAGTVKGQIIERYPVPKNSPPAPVVTGPQPLPAPPPSLEQQPAAAPRVAFQDGQLTIVAQNSSLGAILEDVQAKTGATIDMPSNPTERVVGQFGPGPAREVLASLLNGSHFNYVLLGSPQNPDVLAKVVLLSKSSAPEQPSAASESVAAVPRQGTIVIPSQDADDDNSEEMTEPEQAADDQTNAQQNGMPNTVKTPQELLQELQRQQQQAQQAQQATPQGGIAAPDGTPVPAQRVPNDK